jgi:predicted membrane protein
MKQLDTIDLQDTSMSGRILVGIGLILFGVGIMLDRLGVWDFGDIFSTWWPLILIAVAAIQLMTRSVPPLIAGAIGLIGLALLSWRVGLLPTNPLSFLFPLILIAIGIAIISNRIFASSRSDVTSNIPPINRNIMGAVLPGATSEDRVDLFTAFGGIETVNRSERFQGGNITAMFGGIELNLREATLDPQGATMDVFAAFGGGEIRVPETWRVHVTGLPIFGGWENKTKLPIDSNAPVLRIRCVAAFGGVEVSN